MLNLKPGDKIDGGRYELVKEFDRQGSYSLMYVVRNTRSSVEHLFKVNLSHEELKARDISDAVYKGSKEDHLVRSEWEFDLVRQLQHPNIADYFDKIPFKNHLGLLTNPIRDASPLNEVLDEHNQCQADMGERIKFLSYFFPQIKQVLSFLHDKKIEHKDIKPENLLVDKNFYLYLVDFGVSAEVAEEGAHKTAASLRAAKRHGSLLYRPPFLEQKNSRDFLYYDSWSMGLVCLEFILGKYPFVDCQKNLDQYLDFIGKTSKPELEKKIKRLFSQVNKGVSEYYLKKEGLWQEKMKDPDHFKALIKYDKKQKGRINKMVHQSDLQERREFRQMVGQIRKMVNPDDFSRFLGATAVLVLDR